MNHIPFFLIAILSINAFGQIKEFKAPPVIDKNPVNYLYDKTNYQIDTNLKIIYKHKSETTLEPAYYLNGDFINSSVLKSLDPNRIANVRLEKKYSEINGVKYYGQFFIETKKSYKPDFISLSDLKTKYDELKDAPTLFMIDNELINANYDHYILDQNYLLRIEIGTIENPKEGIRLNLIQILTKSEENIKELNKIRLRGDSALQR